MLYMHYSIRNRVACALSTNICTEIYLKYQKNGNINYEKPFTNSERYGIIHIIIANLTDS